MNIVLLNQFFPPAQAPTGLLLADLARELAGRGHDVTVIASAGAYGAASPGAEPPSGVRVIRTGPAARHRNRLAAKLADYLSFAHGARRALAGLAIRPDVLVCMTTPPFVGQLAARLRKKKGIPYVLWCMDLYPEALSANGWLRAWNPLSPFLRRLARTERGRAAAVIALGPDMAERLRASGAVRVEEIPVWSSLQATSATTAAARDLRRARGWAEDDIVLLYSGNMGRAHRAGEFAALAEHLRGTTPRCRFVFAGDGPLRIEWMEKWGRLFEFAPPASPDDLAAHLLAADVHLVSQQPEWTGVVVPSKFQAACALGRPVVFAGPPHGAVGRWIEQSHAGWVLPPGDAASLETVAREVSQASLRAEKGANAARLHAGHFTPGANCGTLAALVEAMAKRPT